MSAGTLYILAFDHRGSFQKQWFGFDGELSSEQTERIADAKQLIFEGLERALADIADPSLAGGLVDEQFGNPNRVPERIRAAGMKLAMPVEKSGQAEFDFEYGEAFGEHIEGFDPDFVKVLVRYNPSGDADLNRRQEERLRRLSDWLADRRRKLLFELLVPATDGQLGAVGGDRARYDIELRPGLMVEAIGDLQDAGIDVAVWKIEGLDSREDCERVVAQCRAGGRDHVDCVLLGRGASHEAVERWLTVAAPVDGFVGFAIGRSIWGDPLSGFLDDSLPRDDAAARIAANYTHFLRTYEAAAGSA